MAGLLPNFGVIYREKKKKISYALKITLDYVELILQILTLLHCLYI